MGRDVFDGSGRYIGRAEDPEPPPRGLREHMWDLAKGYIVWALFVSTLVVIFCVWVLWG